MVLVRAARTGRAFPSVWASRHCESMGSRWAVPAETPYFRANSQAFELPSGGLRVSRRNRQERTLPGSNMLAHSRPPDGAGRSRGRIAPLRPQSTPGAQVRAVRAPNRRRVVFLFLTTRRLQGQL